MFRSLFPFVLVLALFASHGLAAKKLTNFVFFLIDDLGCYGAEFHETPDLDKLEDEAMKCTNAYSGCTVY